MAVPGTVRSVTFDVLRALGIDTIFGNPGSTELPMFRDFPEDFRYILSLQESVALGMADGYAQATRNAAVTNFHSSAGLGHALGNLFTAAKNQTPLVVTAGQQARSILPFEPFLYAERPTEFPQPFVKWSCEPARAQDVPRAIARAYHIAMTPPYGPTFVSIPVDDWDQPCDPIAPRRVASHLPGDPDLLREIAVALASSTRPALVVGAGIARDQAWDEIIALAERHQAEVWVAPFAARNAFPEDHPLFRGFLLAMRDKINEALHPYDVIVAIGGPLSLYHIEGEGPHVPEGVATYLITDNPSIATWAPAGTALLANCREAIGRLLAGPSPIEPRPLQERASLPALGPGVLTDGYLLQQIAALRRKDAIIVEEAPSSRSPMHDRLPILVKDGFYTCASGGLGHGLPAAIGVALGRPGEHVIAVLGDGSSMYSIQGLWTAAQLGLHITFVIINNGRYEALIGFGRLFGMQQIQGSHLPGIDFCGLARAQGVKSWLVDKTSNLDAALSEAFATKGPTLVEVRVD
ncbi:benzoylformate decarboxylase [Sphingobium sp.]|uniref:benzoylformate decarboxylase n=1 Tax=Sphingobium sp. TaxID=1912891 RepID=UPI0028BE3A9D|nr:benzoylformate decarboxylase [Sphingobium sp.]